VFSATVTGDSGNLNDVIVVVANSNPQGRSRFKLTQFAIQCFPAACPLADRKVPAELLPPAPADALPAQSWSAGIEPFAPVFRDSAVKGSLKDEIPVDGPAATRFSYLLQLPQFSVAAGAVDAKGARAYLIVEGNLEQGGFTVGLLRADQWVHPTNVTAVGPFRVAIPVREPGVYSPLIANNVARDGDPNRFRIVTLRWVRAE
jgi:hypothetical protein